jgi:hypothetical protein
MKTQMNELKIALASTEGERVAAAASQLAVLHSDLGTLLTAARAFQSSRTENAREHLCAKAARLLQHLAALDDTPSDALKRIGEELVAAGSRYIARANEWPALSGHNG